VTPNSLIARPIHKEQGPREEEQKMTEGTVSIRTALDTRRVMQARQANYRSPVPRHDRRRDYWPRPRGRTMTHASPIIRRNCAAKPACTAYTLRRASSGTVATSSTTPACRLEHRRKTVRMAEPWTPAPPRTAPARTPGADPHDPYWPRQWAAIRRRPSGRASYAGQDPLPW